MLLGVLALILLIKGIFLLLDSQPAYFFGDSEAYLSVATTRWIPPDRSFLYGLLIRRLAYRHHSLESLIYFQVLCSAFASWLVCIALSRYLRTRFWIAATFGILCALEPLQLLMERYIMTEAVSNFLFAVHFVLLLAYLARGRIWTLLVSQALGVLLIGIRISFLPEVLLNSILVPLLSPHAVSFYRSMVTRVRSRRLGIDYRALRLVAIHLFLCLLVTQFFLLRYKRWYGRVEDREPALLYEPGAFLVADFAPLIDVQDFPTGSRAQAVMNRVSINRKDPQYRPAHHFFDGGLWHSIQAEYPDPKQANEVGVATARHALLRQPIGALRLSCETFVAYFNVKKLDELLRIDEGVGRRLTATVMEWLKTLYGVRDPQSYAMSITKRWHLLAVPWYWMVLCALAASPLLLLDVKRTGAPPLILIGMTSLLFFEGATLMVDRPTPRFLTTDAWLVLLILGVALESVVSRHQRSLPSPVTQATDVPLEVSVR